MSLDSITTSLSHGAGASANAASSAYHSVRPQIVYSVEVGPEVPGETRVRRYYKNADKITTTPHEDVTTLYESLRFSAQKRPNRNAFGTRPLVKIHVEEKDVKNAQGVVERKKWTYSELANYEWKTYKQVLEASEKIGSTLTTETLGSLKKGSVVGIYAETSEQWLTFAHGAFSQGIVVATIYANLGEEGLIYSLNDTKLTHSLTDATLLFGILKNSSKTPHLKYIFYVDSRESADAKVLDSLKDKGIKVFSFSQSSNLSQSVTVRVNPPKPEDMAVIMYTSGTTGTPKGVMITHANVVGAISGAALVVASFGIGEGDTYCSFLPLAHILELVVEHCILFFGGELAFGSARTMMDNMVKNCKGDLMEARPTLMAGVPVLWERIRKGAQEKINAAPSLRQAIFHTAYNIKYWLLQHNIASAPGLDQVVFAKFKETVGGRSRGIVSGGAPLSHSTHQFLRCVFNVPCVQGYGLTETTGLLAVQPPESLGTEVVGAPFPCTELKLVDVAEMGYTSQDKPFPRGEIWSRGAGTTSGYYNQPEKTKEEFKEGGWFATGDIAQWNADGTLSIIDRKKNLVKLSHGEYIASEAMESKYKQDPFVDEICIIANSQKDLPAAIVVPNRKTSTAWAEQNGLDTSDFDKLVKEEKVRDAVKKSLHATATKERMKNFEKPCNVLVTADEWTIDSGSVTAAMKLKRQEISKKYKQDIDKSFA